MPRVSFVFMRHFVFLKNLSELAATLLTLVILGAYSPISHASEDDSVVVIIEENDDSGLVNDKVSPASPFSRFNDTFYVSAKGELGAYLQQVDSTFRPVRALGSVNGKMSFSLWHFLDVELSAFARIPADIAFDEQSSKNAAAIPYFALYDSSIKLVFDGFSLRIGHLLMPIHVGGDFSLNDRVNAHDFRRGPNFIASSWGKIPLPGFIFEASIGAFEINVGAFAHYFPSEGSIIASEQGGFRLGSIQSAFFRDPGELEPAFSDGLRQELFEPKAWFKTPSLALQMAYSFLEIDWQLFALLGYNEIPKLSLGGRPFSYETTLSLGIGANFSQGIFVLSGEVFVRPRMGSFGGQTTLIKSTNGLSTNQLSHFGFSFAIESSYGQWVSANLQIVDMFWLNAPRDGILFGVEKLELDTKKRTLVNRLALVFGVSGRLFDRKIAWRLNAEAGIWPTDLLSGCEIKYFFADEHLYVAAHGELFFGQRGSPGWLRAKASNFGFLIGAQV